MFMIIGSIQQLLFQEPIRLRWSEMGCERVKYVFHWIRIGRPNGKKRMTPALETTDAWHEQPGLGFYPIHLDEHTNEIFVAIL